MNTDNGNENAQRFVVFEGHYGYEFGSFEEAMARLQKLKAENQHKGAPWRPTYVRRYKDGTVELWLEGFYFDAAYTPRVWRC